MSTAIHQNPQSSEQAERVSAGVPAALVSRPVKRFVVLQQPEVAISWAADFPDTVKLRKGVNVFPFQFALEATYHKQTNDFSYGCSCQDKLLGGAIRMDVPSKHLHYRKRLALGNGASMALTGRCSYKGFLQGTDHMKPSFSIRYELGQGSASLGQDVVGLRQRLPVSRHLGVEFCGNVRLPLTTAEYSIEEGHNNFALGDGPLQLHVEQTNLILQL